MRFLLLALLTVAVVACGSGTDSGAPGNPAITVKQALTAKPGEAVLVRGALIVSGGITRLCYAVLESYPRSAAARRSSCGSSTSTPSAS
jgi:hypothetical protein